MLLAAVGFSVTASTSHAGAGSAVTNEAEAEARWGAVLSQYVNPAGQVDFDGLSQDRADLNAYVAYIAKVGPNNHPERFRTRQARLSYYINSYNALSMHAVIEDGIPRSLGGLKKVSFFALKQHRIGTEWTSLYGYENNVIRKQGDPRVHFALNCMSVGCPRLPREPFTADQVDEQLDRETARFLGEARNLNVDHKRRTVTLSEIFDFFPSDFRAQSGSLIGYVNRYVDDDIPAHYEVEFFDYDWTVNRQRRGE